MFSAKAQEYLDLAVRADDEREVYKRIVERYLRIVLELESISDRQLLRGIDWGDQVGARSVGFER